MPVFGLSTGIIAILAYNYGARNKERIYSCIKTALIWACVIMLIGGIQMTTLGIVGEYIAKIYIQGKERPIYIMKEMVRLPAEPQREHDAAAEDTDPLI